MTSLAGRLVVQRFRWNEIRRRTGQNLPLLNPFIPLLGEHTKHWSKPRYSLRRQAVLVKNARAAGLLHLLPPGPKADSGEISHALRGHRALDSSPLVDASSTQEPTQSTPNVQWEGSWHVKQVEGSSIGARLYAGKKRLFKGHKWERNSARKSARLGMLLKDMDKRVHRWRMHRVRKIRNPIAPPRPSKSTKLPF